MRALELITIMVCVALICDAIKTVFVCVCDEEEEEEYHD